MNTTLRSTAEQIISQSIHAVLPDEAVKRALSNWQFTGKIILVAAGKAAWQMAKAAMAEIGPSVTDGIVITKYDHVLGEIPGLTCVEAGHPVPDENSFCGTQKAVELVSNLSADDTVLFLLSGGGSALFELPLIEAQELQDITNKLLACGADIVEINTIRKRLSAVKGGRFAEICAPAHVYGVVLSDILGDPLDMIASGPACEDHTTNEQAKAIINKYHIPLSQKAAACMDNETPKELHNVTTMITGSVKELCLAAATACEQQGYKPIILTDLMCGEAREAGLFMASILKSQKDTEESLAFIAGGETIVHLTGSGKGGRNQELALAVAPEIAGLDNIALFSIGSDGTDGPTDAAGGYVDGDTAETLSAQGIQIFETLKNNDAYHALQAADGLIKTGPTGTNVNDVAVGLIKH